MVHEAVDHAHRHRRATGVIAHAAVQPEAEQWAGHHGPGRHEARSPRSRRLGLLAVAVAVATAAWLVVVTEHGNGPEPAAGTAAVLAPTGQAAVSWVRANLSASARVLGEGPVVAALAAAGFPAESIATTGANWRDFNYVITSSAANALGPARQSSSPVAVFAGLEVRQIVTHDLVGLLQARLADRADRADRLMAGAALLRNPALASAAQPKTVLVDGDLDMRPAAVLVALGAQARVDLDAIDVVPAEAAAALPARSISFDHRIPQAPRRY